MRHAIRFLAAAAAVLALPGGSSCEDNLGDAEPGPVSFRVSIDTQSVESDGASQQPSASADGRYVAFASRATNLALAQSGFQEIFVRDRLADSCENVSRLGQISNATDRADCLQPAISADGRYVVFRSTASFFGGPVLAGTTLYRFDRETDTLEEVLPVVPDADCLNASISEDGTRIAFESAATNLGFTSASAQIYVSEMPGGVPPTITLLSHAAGAPATPCNNTAQQPQISANGQFVVYQSRSTNLTADTTAGRRMVWLSAADGSSTELVSRESGVAGAALDNHCGLASVSRDGRYVSFLYQGGTAAPPPPVPQDLRFPLMRRDRGATPAPVTTAAGSDVFGLSIFSPIVGGPSTSISDDGRFIAYLSTNFPVTDLFVRVRDLEGGTTTPTPSLIPAGGSTLNDFPTCTLSGDGRWVFWTSGFEGQVLGDTNAAEDVFGFGPLR